MLYVHFSIPVSYTHLDVYKRQLYGPANGVFRGESTPGHGVLRAARRGAIRAGRHAARAPGRLRAGECKMIKIYCKTPRGVV